MKKILWIVLFLVVIPHASAEIVKSKGEIRIGDAIKQIHSQISNAEINIGNIYDSATDYVLDHPAQFDADDKAALNDLTTYILAVKSEMNNLKNYIETNWPGLTK